MSSTDVERQTTCIPWYHGTMLHAKILCPSRRAQTIDTVYIILGTHIYFVLLLPLLLFAHPFEDMIIVYLLLAPLLTKSTHICRTNSTMVPVRAKIFNMPQTAMVHAAMNEYFSKAALFNRYILSGI